MSTFIILLRKGLASEFSMYSTYCRRLHFDEQPDYLSTRLHLRLDNVEAEKFSMSYRLVSLDWLSHAMTKIQLDKLETILEQSQKVNQKSLEFINEHRNNLREFTAKTNEIADRHQANSPVDIRKIADHNPEHCDDETCLIKNCRFSTECLVLCEDSENGNRWTIVQKRYNGSVGFHRTWVRIYD
uniref:Fibrinogen C-terminal domain-containing protein n=1 Tax=Glossina austeni TaxID=7395 RepID=A0A1A9VQD8_GLOAU